MSSLTSADFRQLFLTSFYSQPKRFAGTSAGTFYWSDFGHAVHDGYRIPAHGFGQHSNTFEGIMISSFEREPFPGKWVL
jgi:hypothetical protein